MGSFYIASGGLRIGGAVRLYIGSGKARLGGSASYFYKPYFRFNVIYGRIRVRRQMTSPAVLTPNPIATYVSGGVLRIVGAVDNPYSRVASGNILVKGAATTLLKQTVSASGKLRLGGTATYAGYSSYWAFTASGGLRVRTYAYQEEVESQIPVAWWKLNETSGSTTTNYGSADSVDGTYVNFTANAGIPLPTRESSPSASATFNGSTSSGYILIPDSSDINTSGPYPSRTVSAWFRVNNLSSRQVIFKEGDYNDGLCLYVNTDGKLYFNAYHTSGPNPQRWGGTYCSANIQANKIYFAVCVFGSTGVKLYLNGSLADQNNTPAVGSLETHDQAVIGANHGGIKYHDTNGSFLGEFFAGLIEHVVIYNVELSNQEVLNQWNLGQNLDYSLVLPAAGSGKLALGFSADYPPPNEASGLVRFLGSALVSASYSYVSDGGLFVGSTLSSKPTYNYTASGKIYVEGSVAGGVASSSWTYVSGGLLTTGGSTNKPVWSIPYAGTGNVLIQSSANAVLSFAYKSSGNLSIGSHAGYVIEFSRSATFTWDISEGVLRNWRVQGTCRSTKHACPPMTDDSPDCGGVPGGSGLVQLFANVQAHSLADLCDKLKAKGTFGPISKIQMWSLPAKKSDWASDADPSCNNLTTVDFSKIPECLDFTIDFTTSVRAKVTSSLIFQSDFSYVASGKLGFGIEAEVLSSFYSYVGSGSLRVGYSVTVSSPQYWFYAASGSLKLGGQSLAFSSDYGTLGMRARFSTAVINLGINFGYQPAKELVPSQDLVEATACDTLMLPQILFLRHELNRSLTLSNFLKVNGFTLPSVVNLSYSRLKNSWYSTIHYEGRSVNQNQREVWDILFDFGGLTENAVLGIPPDVWSFSILVKKRGVTNLKSEVTRLVMSFDPQQVCDVTGSLKFVFSLNPSTRTTTPPVVSSLVLTDGLSIFKGPTYQRNPVTNFQIGVATPDAGVGLFDQTVPYKRMLLSVL